MDYIDNSTPVSADPRTWDLVAPKHQRRRRLRRELGGIWFAARYLGMSDDIYDYLRKPKYICFRQNGTDVAIFVCDKDHPGAMQVQDPRGPNPGSIMMFYHVWLPSRLAGSFRVGRRNHATFKQMIGHEPHILLESAVNNS